MATSILLWVSATALILVGFVATVVPGLPGIPLMLLGMFLAAWIENFTRIGWWTLAVLTLLAVLSVALDFGAAALGAKRVGASRQAILGATLGSVTGMCFGLAGFILGPFSGAVIGELLARRRMVRDDARAAVRVGVGAWIGFVIGTIAKLALAFTMLGVFAAAWIID